MEMEKHGNENYTHKNRTSYTRESQSQVILAAISENSELKQRQNKPWIQDKGLELAGTLS